MVTWPATGRFGYQAGDNAFNYHSTYTKVYDVADLVGGPIVYPGNRPQIDFTAVLAVIRHAGIGESEDDFNVREFPTNLSVVVTANGIVHRRIQTMLEECRRNALPDSRIGKASSAKG